MHRISACIVNYNDYENTRAAAASLLEHCAAFDLYIVDNCSTDGSFEKLKGDFPQATVIKTEKNDGFGAGHNAVLPLLESEYHAVVNPDITMNSDVLGNMSAFFDENPDIALACPATYNTDGTLQLLPKRIPKLSYLLAGRIKTKSLDEKRRFYIMDGEDLSKVTDVDFVTGCFMFTRTALFKETGGFDTRYFMYFEDADLTLKMQKFGRTVYYPFARVTHGYHRQSKGNLRFLMIHVASMFKYFRKWRKERGK